MKKLVIVFSVVGMLFTTQTKAQDKKYDIIGSDLNRLNYAVPFLTIAPDSRAAAMGDAGAATSPDVNSMHWNPAKYAFMESDMAISVSYIPWLRNLVDDINLANVTYFQRIDKKQTFAASLMYFSLGDIIFTNDQGITTGGKASPNEFAIDAAYSRLFTDYFSGSVAFRYIRSDITNGAGQEGTNAANSFAADVAFYYNRPISLSGNKVDLGLGINVSNIGNKITYTDDANRQFLPTNLRLGTSLGYEIDDYNKFVVALDLNKLLVPTPSESGGTNEYSDMSVPEGIFRSFGDGWKNGTFNEELSEITYSFGLEYWYANQFAIRGGYFHEHENKGNRKYFSTGFGVKMNVFTFDLSYLIPRFNDHPLAKTVRFTLGFDIASFRTK